jgi:20S proteasome alpha/beta subunit
MTVCIAALANNKKELVLVSDKMISITTPMAYQYETDDVYKIYTITDYCVAMTAGNAINAYQIIQNAKNQIIVNNISTIEDIAATVRSEYQNYRKKLIVETTLKPRGMTIDKYYEKQKDLALAVIQEIENQLVNANIGVDLIIAGYNKDEDCHIFSIIHPGVINSHDSIGYACVGIGAPHALYSLIDSDYKKTLSTDEVEALVLKAKQKSEKAPGVGKLVTKMRLPSSKKREGI